jgi:hypothetical protein
MSWQEEIYKPANQKYRGNGKHYWEPVTNDTQRLRVPGGWLYSDEIHSVMTFIPLLLLARQFSPISMNLALSKTLRRVLKGRLSTVLAFAMMMKLASKSRVCSKQRMTS